jgi:hypothetical protein
MLNDVCDGFTNCDDVCSTGNASISFSCMNWDYSLEFCIQFLRYMATTALVDACPCTLLNQRLHHLFF